MRVGISVYCKECGQEKKPHGRSAPFGMCMCEDDCPGYREEPKVGCLWNGETEADFGYKCCSDGTKEVNGPNRTLRDI